MGWTNKDKQRQYETSYRQKKRKQIREKDKRYYTRHKEEIKQKRNERKRLYYATHKEEFKDKRKQNSQYIKDWHHQNRLKKYNLTEEQFQEMFRQQQGLCAICKEPQTLCIDHDHETGEVRGLLCRECNSAIGFLKDNIDNLKSAITYLSK